MTTTKRTPPPKLVDDINVSAMSEPKKEKAASEPQTTPAKAPAKKAAAAPKPPAEAAPAAKAKVEAPAVAKKLPEDAVTEKKEEAKKPSRSSASKPKEKPAEPVKPAKPAAKTTKAGSTSATAPTQAELDRLIQAEIKHMIEEAAYYLAERRNFAPGHEQEDWAAATAEVLAKLRSGEIK